ncbi:MAG: DASS family sodium-coupled anion symporter [Planctomycetia bacterium]|nr:DASS family sodium-coupled anion symporter [Planctomycetia bacterium]
MDGRSERPARRSGQPRAGLIARGYTPAMDLSPEAQALAPIVVAVIVLWVTEALPLAVTALLGAVACVVAGVAPAREVFRPFADPLIFLFIGSFLIAEAIKQHGLDRRLAYGVLSVPWVGERPGRILAAVAAVSVAISAFISNTCTAAMMLAIVSGILGAVEAAARATGRSPAPAFATSLFLCVAFAASIGGLATPIGTPPNLIGLTFIRDEAGVAVSFLGWCAIGVPLVTVMATVAVRVLAWMFPAGIDRLEGVAGYVAEERGRLGPWTAGQRSTAVAFAVTVCLWVLPGILLVVLGAAHPVSAWLTRRLPEGVAALIGAILLFLLPGDRTSGDGRRRRALSWHETRIDWDIVLLYGGGMALGELCFSTGLAAALGTSITTLIPAGDWSGTVLVAVAALVAVVTSEFTSNTASATMVVPVVIALARATGNEPLPAALAATFAASLGFMMPVSTPCNALVYGSGRVPLKAMMAGGAVIDVVGTLVVTAAMLIAGRLWLAP